VAEDATQDIPTARALRGRCALVTGGARRIGRATALALAAAGCDVIVHYNRSEGDALEVAEAVGAMGRRCEIVRADFADDGELSSLIDRAAQKLRQPDILINNSSIFPECNFACATFDNLMENVRANAWGPFELARSFAAGVDGYGSIINLLDSRVKAYDWQHVPYHLSKSMLATMTRVLAVKLAPNVTVNGVAPGLIMAPEGKDQDYMESLKDRVPMHKVGSPGDVTDAIVYLCGCEYVTGQVIFVDGGRNLVGT
jgi:pteridine reductase